MLYYKLIRALLSLAVCLDCRESSFFHTTMLRVFSNIIGGLILLHFNCDSKVPAEGTGYTSYNLMRLALLCRLATCVLLHFSDYDIMCGLCSPENSINIIV